MSLLRKYWHKLGNALLNFQFMEEIIRMYLGIAYDVVKKKLDNQIPFKFSYRDIKQDSLGTLVTKFEKFNSNKQLIEEVVRLVKIRNYCAHQAYLMTAEQQKDDKYLSGEIKKMETVIRSSDQCVRHLHRELERIEKIRNKLYGITRINNPRKK